MVAVVNIYNWKAYINFTPRVQLQDNNDMHMRNGRIKSIKSDRWPQTNNSLIMEHWVFNLQDIRARDTDISSTVVIDWNIQAKKADKYQ